ncbi:MAG: HPr family phosphocarrier protein [Deltaproteobacteria bacterium]|nr:MAG: HPr family phosphocarrier protein [Deltaproteobacteria bacterium]
MTDTPTSGTLTIVNDLGLHARAAAKLVGLANKFDADVYLEREGREVNAKSILGVLMLACGKGSEIGLRTEGPEAAEAYAAIAKLIEEGFGEL